MEAFASSAESQCLGFKECSASNPTLKPPKIKDLGLNAEMVVEGLVFPTSMAFLGPDDILVLEKNNGQVRRIINGSLLPEPLLDLNISNQSERGLLGIAVKNNENNIQNNKNNEGQPATATDVFLYFTESIAEEEGNDKNNQEVRNSLYKYQFIDNELVNPKKLLELPS